MFGWLICRQCRQHAAAFTPHLSVSPLVVSALSFTFVIDGNKHRMMLQRKWTNFYCAFTAAAVQRIGGGANGALPPALFCSPLPKKTKPLKGLAMCSHDRRNIWWKEIVCDSPTEHCVIEVGVPGFYCVFHCTCLCSILVGRVFWFYCSFFLQSMSWQMQLELHQNTTFQMKREKTSDLAIGNRSCAHTVITANFKPLWRVHGRHIYRGVYSDTTQLNWAQLNSTELNSTAWTTVDSVCRSWCHKQKHDWLGCTLFSLVSWVELVELSLVEFSWV